MFLHYRLPLFRLGSAVYYDSLYEDWQGDAELNIFAPGHPDGSGWFPRAKPRLRSDGYPTGIEFIGWNAEKIYWPYYSE